MAKTKLKSYTLAEMKDKYIGKVGPEKEMNMNMNYGWMF